MIHPLEQQARNVNVKRLEHIDGSTEQTQAKAFVQVSLIYDENFKDMKHLNISEANLSVAAINFQIVVLHLSG